MFAGFNKPFGLHRLGIVVQPRPRKPHSCSCLQVRHDVDDHHVDDHDDVDDHHDVDDHEIVDDHNDVDDHDEDDDGSVRGPDLGNW